MSEREDCVKPPAAASPAGNREARRMLRRRGAPRLLLGDPAGSEWIPPSATRGSHAAAAANATSWPRSASACASGSSGRKWPSLGMQLKSTRTGPSSGHGKKHAARIVYERAWRPIASCSRSVKAEIDEVGAAEARERRGRRALPRHPRARRVGGGHRPGRAARPARPARVPHRRARAGREPRDRRLLRRRLALGVRREGARRARLRERRLARRRLHRLEAERLPGRDAARAHARSSAAATRATC